MDKYLLEILKEINTIIIPGLGALTITNASTGEIMFMPYLKYDDNKLSQYIAEKEGIAETEAKNMIAKYVREVEAKLNTGESYDMYQFGSFRKNASGDLEFNQWNKDDKAEEPNATIPQETQKEVIADEEPVEKVHKLTEKDAVEEIIATEDTKQEDETTNEQENLNEVESIVVEEIPESEYVPEIMEEIIPPISTYTVEDQWKDDLDLPPIGTTIERPKKPILEKTKKDKKRKGAGFYALLTIFVLLIGGTLTFILFYNSLEKFIPFLAKESKETKNIVLEKEPAETTNTEAADSIVHVEESVPETDETTEPVAENENAVESTPAASSNMIQTSTGQVDRSKPFHIVGGAFSDKSNADRYQERLNAQGNNSVIIGKFDNLFIVSIASYDSKEAAEKALSEAKGVSPHAWVFKWP